MSTTSDPFDFDHRIEAPPEQRRLDTEHVLLENDDAPDELAIFSPESGPDQFEWVVATGAESFVGLPKVR